MSSRVGELLVRLGEITPDQLQQAQQFQLQSGGLIGAAIVKLGWLQEPRLVETLSEQYGLPLIDLEDFTTESEATKLVPHELALRHLALPLLCTPSSLTVAMADPSNIQAVNELKFVTGRELKVVLAPESALRSHLDRAYGGTASYDRIIQDLEPVTEVSVSEDDARELHRATEDAPVVKLVNAILSDAIKRGASDIHLEPYEGSFRVRFRIDGVLYEIMKPPFKLKNAITSRIKVMADLDIAERRLPQDGRIKLRLANGREMDFRVSVLPGLFGEKVVLRLLDRSTVQGDIAGLGFSQQQLALVRSAINQPYGLVLVTGPTGSGKTTTLYSALTERNQTTVNISTAEDPVEFNLPGINQVQTHDEIGLTFAAALRSFLRQDPDIILVGEIRDGETAEIAVKASLTGHLVLSTVHTNDAPTTVNRLLNMGLEPFMVASSLTLVVAQRLARRICDHCRAPHAVPPEAVIAAGGQVNGPIQSFRGAGCQRCSGTGFRGRVALYECMPVTDPIKECILRSASAAELKRIAVNQGMKTLRQSGLELFQHGTTTLEEVLRVTASDNDLRMEGA